ncbi:hypothetical protein S245_004713, partial [Arachis hypogaea]
YHHLHRESCMLWKKLEQFRKGETDCKRGKIGHIKISFWGGPFDIKKLLSNSRTSGEYW